MPSQATGAARGNPFVAFTFLVAALSIAPAAGAQGAPAAWEEGMGTAEAAADRPMQDGPDPSSPPDVPMDQLEEEALDAAGWLLRTADGAPGWSEDLFDDLFPNMGPMVEFNLFERMVNSTVKAKEMGIEAQPQWPDATRDAPPQDDGWRPRLEEARAALPALPSQESLEPQQEAPCACPAEAGPLPGPRASVEAAAPPSAGLFPAAVQAGAALVGGLLLWRLLAGLLVRRPELHPRAQLILRTVCENPGITFRELLEATGLANGVALHHLGRLEKGGHLVAHRHLNTLRFFENHGRYAATWREAAVLRDRLNERLHRWLAANPGATQAEVVAGSREWGWRRGLTQKRLALLEQAGLLSRSREGRLVRYAAVPPSAPLPSPSPSALPALDLGPGPQGVSPEAGGGPPSAAKV